MKPRRIQAVFVLCIAIVLILSACNRETSPRSAGAGGPNFRPKAPGGAQHAFEEGARLGKSGKYQAAVEAYSRAIKLDPTYRDAYTFRGLTYLELGNFSAAISDLDSVVKLDPSADSYRTRADVYLRNGQIDKAITDYNKSIKLNPNDASAYRNRGTAYGERRDYSKALVDITKAIQLDPGEPRWRFDRATLKARQGNYDDAMVDAEEALRLAGGVPNLHPGEARITNEFTFNCMRLIADLERAGAKRTR